MYKKQAERGTKMNAGFKNDWILRICVIIITFIIIYGALIKSWLGLPGKIETIEGDVKKLSAIPEKIGTMEIGINELLAEQSRRIFTVVPEKREVRSSTNPRLFQLEIPSYAVKEPSAFEFDQMPTLTLPAPFGQGHEFLGWSVAFGPRDVKLIEPFSAKVELNAKEIEKKDSLELLHWSPEKMKWHDVPISIGQDRITGKFLLDFKTKDLGLYALSLKSVR